MIFERQLRTTGYHRFFLNTFLAWMLAITCGGYFAHAEVAGEEPSKGKPASRPNLLIILTDDLGFGDVSYHGATDVQTPHIDRLAQEGMQFTTMRANCTVCSPTRAALMTGRYADRVGVPGVIRTHPDNSWGYLDPGVPTIADHLRDVGYHTAIVGKWHLGLDSPNTPNERGFDFFHGFLGDMMDSYWHHRRHDQNYLRLNQQPLEVEGHATDVFTEWAQDYLRERSEQADRPFFLYLAYNAPHFPIEPPESWLERVQQREPQLEPLRAKNVAFVEHLDDCIGRVLETLRETGLEENTVVAFTNDNGGSIPHGQSNLPWRGGKQSHYEGGLRVPFLVRWPAQIPGNSTSDYPGLLFDLFPTCLELAGATLPEDLDSISLLPALRGEAIPGPRELYFVRREGGVHGGKSYEALIRGDWKLLQNDPFGPLELYNLKEDPYETTDRIQDHPAMARELLAAMRRHIQRGGSVPWQAPVVDDTSPD